MSDYTPTTEEIRSFYRGSSFSQGEQFDRWLESTLQKAQIIERERIISNIYERVSDLRSCTKDDNCVELGELIEEYIPEWTEGDNK